MPPLPVQLGCCRAGMSSVWAACSTGWPNQPSVELWSWREVFWQHCPASKNSWPPKPGACRIWSPPGTCPCSSGGGAGAVGASLAPVTGWSCCWAHREQGEVGQGRLGHVGLGPALPSTAPQQASAPACPSHLLLCCSSCAQRILWNPRGTLGTAGDRAASCTQLT